MFEIIWGIKDYKICLEDTCKIVTTNLISKNVVYEMIRRKGYSPKKHEIINFLQYKNKNNYISYFIIKEKEFPDEV